VTGVQTCALPISDALGLYTLNIPRGKHILKIKSQGMRETQRQIILYTDGKLDVEMRESVIALKEVSVKEIGRASCREGVCTRGGAGTVRKRK